MDDSKRISIAVIKRLPRYYRYLGDLLDKDITRISSKELSKRMNITASQIRQDLNNFGCFGQQGYGYNVELLFNEIKKILGLTREYHVIIIGAGNIGQALMNYDTFARRGFRFTAIFDTNPKIIGLTLKGIEVQDVENIKEYLANHTVDIAVFAMPKTKAQEMAKIVAHHGVRGIWNFSSTDLAAPDNLIVENVHLTDSLMTLSYQLNQYQQQDQD